VLNPNQAVDVDVQRGTEILHKTLVPQAVGRDQLGNVGWIPEGPAKIDAVEPGLPADKAGIQVGDEIESLNGSPNAAALVGILQAKKDKPMQLSLRRKGQPITVNLTPVLTEDKENPGQHRYRIGVGITEIMRVARLPFPEALGAAVNTCKLNSGLVFEL